MSKPVPQVDALLDRQKDAWTGGDRPRVEDLLADSSLSGEPEAFLDLLYNEIVLREELGEAPGLDEYVARYPQLADDLRLHFEVHAALHADLMIQTRRVEEAGTVEDEDSPLPDAGPALRDYEVLGRLGQGGMAVVYRARHRGLNRQVALKMFQPGRVPTARERDRFQTEAEAIARLQHPNIVQIFEVGQSQGLPFLALELAEGGTLARKLQNLPYAPKAAAELVRTLARAVQHAHENQIIHRDLKPANVLFARDGTPKITDFGLAKILEGDGDSPRDATRTGEPMGTPRYMAPEQAAGRPDQVGPATDVYALGTLLYECLTGQVPFVAPGVLATMQMIREEEPLSPRRLQRAVPRDLETICLKCLHKQPARRYSGAQALAADLDRFLHGEPIRARPMTARERIWMWCRRRPAHAVLAAALLLAVCGGLVAFGIHRHLERQRVEGKRRELANLMREGHEALARDDDRTAEERFLRAMALVRGEPELQEHQIHVAGWLDHSRRLEEQERWRKRRPPPLFDELRDEALVRCVLPGPSATESTAAARRAIRAALGLTVAADPAWRTEREQLALLEADLLLREGDPAGALKVLDEATGIESRLWHHRRADCLDRLGRNTDAEEERRRAEQHSPKDTLQFFLSGIDRLQRGDAAGAARDFDDLLARAPDHFMGRLFQAAAFLRLKRLGEAKVALTACLGQRPYFAWTCLLLSEVHLRSNDPAAALNELRRGLDMKPRDAARRALLVARGFLHLRLEKWEPARADFDEALTLQADAADAVVGRGKALAALGRHREAIAEAERADPLDRPDLLVHRAGVFARCAVLAGADEDEPQRLARKAQYEERAVENLRAALDLLPRSQRKEYWNETILSDASLRPLGDRLDFAKLARQMQE
jgi:tetratricopeptide (TPR) repeat protein/tRNA A-37 threonylcarbamoyl transferase component Bud32